MRVINVANPQLNLLSLLLSTSGRSAPFGVVRWISYFQMEKRFEF